MGVEQFASVNGIEVCFETFGDPGDPAMLLVMGLGGQMIWWDDDLCARLSAEGFHVIRFDNRDAGRSTTFDRAGTPKAGQLRRREPGPYSLDDMAADAAGLLDHLGIGAAHVVGVSMGGMIAQTLAIRHPSRVLSLCSMSSSTGDPSVGKMRWRLWPVFMRPLPKKRERYIAAFARLSTAVGSRKAYKADPARVRALAERSFDRGVHPDGTVRQLAAALAAPDRTPVLRNVKVPTVVIHGADDRLINKSGGRATAAAIPGARLVEIKGMAHDMPPQVFDRLVEEITQNAKRAASAPLHV
jgi:pimeloyl-ACP methyl ester carboxylesterase